MTTDCEREALLRIMRANWHYGYEGMADGILAAGWTPPSRASVAQQVGDVREAANGLEAAAQWHDMRRRQTPDAFEMEFHEASAAAIRALPALEVTGGQPMATAPTDGTPVLVWAVPREGLNGFFVIAAYHPDAGWCVDELREAALWWPIVVPAPEVTDAMVERGAKLLDAHLDLSPGQLRGLARAVLLDALQPGEGSR